MRRLALIVLCTLFIGVITEAAAQPQQQPPPPPKPSMKEVRKLRLRFRNEPTVRETLDAALRFFKVHPERVKRYRSGAEWKALMPDLEATFNMERGDNVRNLTDAIYELRFPVKEKENTARTGYTVGVRAHWSLDRLVFNAESLDVASLVGVQEGLLREVVSLYFTRRRLMTILALSPPQEPFEQITEQIRLDEVSANVDALTGGYFGKELKKRFPEAE